MGYVAFDTSAINWFYKNGIEGQGVAAILERKGLLPAVGIYTTYELGKDFLNRDPSNVDQKRSKGLFDLLRELKPNFICDRRELYRMEQKKLKTGTSVNCFLPQTTLNLMNIRTEAARNGLFDELPYIDEREAQTEKARQNWMFTEKVNVAKDFKYYLSKWWQDLKDRNSEIFRITRDGLHNLDIILTDTDLLKVTEIPEEYPALSTFIRCLMYLSFSAQTNQGSPSKDKIPDSIQLTEASYCKFFLTADENLIKRSRLIIPYLETTSPLSFIKE